MVWGRGFRGGKPGLQASLWPCRAGVESVVLRMLRTEGKDQVRGDDDDGVGDEENGMAERCRAGEKEPGEGEDGEEELGAVDGEVGGAEVGETPEDGEEGRDDGPEGQHGQGLSWGRGMVPALVVQRHRLTVCRTCDEQCAGEGLGCSERLEIAGLPCRNLGR